MAIQHRPCLRRSLAALLLALPLCLLAPAAAASAAPQRAKAKQPTKPQEQPACANVFKTPEDAIKLAWKEKSEQRLEIFSDDGKAHTMRARLGDFALKDADGKTLGDLTLKTDGKGFIKIEPETATVTEAAGVPLLVRVERTTAVRPGVYVGSLLLSEEGTGAKVCTQRMSVQLTVADATPLSDKLTLHAYRLVPFTPLWTCYECAVPLKGPLEVKTTAMSKDVPLGGIQNKDGGTAAVYWTGATSSSPDGMSLMPVRLSGLGPAGQYEGRLRLGPAADEAASVNLTLDASDIVVWPILTIALSTWLGLQAQRYLNVRRPIWRLREQEAALGVAFDASRKRFDEKSRDSAFAAYSIAEDFERRRGALRQKIGELQAGSALTLDTSADPYKAILEELKQLRQAAAAWAGFADALAALRDASAQDPGSPPVDYKGQVPALMLWGRSLLGGDALTLDRFTERAGEVREATAAARHWLKLKDRIAEDLKRAGRLRAAAASMTTEQLASLDTVESDLRTAELRLWKADSPAALGRLTEAGGRLDTAEDELDELAANVAVEPVAAHGSLAASARASLGALRGAFARESATPDEPADDRERQRFYAIAVRRWDVALTLLAFFIATLTALYNNYFGKSFGSLRDYVGLVILGLGTKVAVDTVSAALGWLFGGELSQRLRGGS